MKKLNDVALKLLAKAAYANAEKEANSACLFIGYQPKMPQKVKRTERKKIIFSYGQIAEKCSILHEDKRTSG